MESIIISSLSTDVKQKLKRAIHRRLESHSLEAVLGTIPSETKRNIFVFSLFESLPKCATGDKSSDDKIIANLRHLLHVVLKNDSKAAPVSSDTKKAKATKNRDVVKSNNTSKSKAVIKSDKTIRCADQPEVENSDITEESTIGAISSESMDCQSESQLIEDAFDQPISTVATDDLNLEKVPPLSVDSTPAAGTETGKQIGTDQKEVIDMPKSKRKRKKTQETHSANSIGDYPSDVSGKRKNQAWTDMYRQMTTAAYNDLELRWARQPSSTLSVNCNHRHIRDCFRCIRMLLCQPVSYCKQVNCSDKDHVTGVFPHGREDSQKFHDSVNFQVELAKCSHRMHQHELFPSMLYVRTHNLADRELKHQFMCKSVNEYVGYIQSELCKTSKS